MGFGIHPPVNGGLGQAGNVCAGSPGVTHGALDACQVASPVSIETDNLTHGYSKGIHCHSMLSLIGTCCIYQPMVTKKSKSFLILGLCAAAGVGVVLLFLTRKPAVLYHITYLPTLGGFRTDPHAINDRGQVIGIAETPTGTFYVFLWDKEQGFRTLERFDDPPHAGGLSINNAGQIVGTVADPNVNQRAFFWDLSAGKQLLGTLGGKQSAGEGLNNRGQVIGSAEIPGRHRHAFVWDAVTGMKDLGTLGGYTSGAVSINDAGQIVGYAETADRHYRVVLWDPIPTTDQDAREGSDVAVRSAASDRQPGSVSAGPPGYRLIDLGDGGVGPVACEINNRGLVVRRHAVTSGKTRFITWTQATGAKTLDFVIDSGIAVGLNENNQFIIRGKPTGLKMFGRVFRRRHHCYLWDPNTGPLLLESRLPVKDIQHLGTKDVNNRGQIIGTLWTKDSNQIRAVVLERAEGKNIER